MQSQEELTQLIALCLKEKKQMNFQEFKKLTEDVCSDMFLCVLENMMFFIGIFVSAFNNTIV